MTSSDVQHTKLTRTTVRTENRHAFSCYDLEPEQTKHKRGPRRLVTLRSIQHGRHGR